MGPDGCLYAVGGYGCISSSDKSEKDISAECLNSAERYDFELD